MQIDTSKGNVVGADDATELLSKPDDDSKQRFLDATVKEVTKKKAAKAPRKTPVEKKKLGSVLSIGGGVQKGSIQSRTMQDSIKDILQEVRQSCDQLKKHANLLQMTTRASSKTGGLIPFDLRKFK